MQPKSVVQQPVNGDKDDEEFDEPEGAVNKNLGDDDDNDDDDFKQIEKVSGQRCSRL